MSVQTNGVHDVAGYAEAVRRALAGFGPEQVDDLTDGLEADLAEALADAPAGSDPVALFGTPEEYAAELGAAAGLTPPVPPGRHGLWDGLRHPVRTAVRRTEALLARWRTTRWWPPVEEFLVALRPVWWVLRGWVVYQLLQRLVDAGRIEWVPSDPAGFVVFVVLVVASVQWGRGRWQVPQRWRRVLLVVGAVAAVAAVPLVAWLGVVRVPYIDAGAAPAVMYEEVPVDGVVVDGMQVSNLFVYDAEGNPLEDVQIYDDRGRPVRTTYDEGQAQWFMPGDDVPWQFVGAPGEDGRVRWNVYPLRGAHADAFAYDELAGRMVPGEGAEVQLPPLPFAKAPALVAADETRSDEVASDATESEAATPQAAPSEATPSGAAATPSSDPSSPSQASTTPEQPSSPPAS